MSNERLVTLAQSTNNNFGRLPNTRNLVPRRAGHDVRNSLLGLQDRRLVTDDGDEVVVSSNLDIRARLDPESGDGRAL